MPLTETGVRQRKNKTFIIEHRCYYCGVEEWHSIYWCKEHRRFECIVSEVSNAT